MLDKFLDILQYTAEDIEVIETSTCGQSTNEVWTEMRKYLLTASLFKRVVSNINSSRKAPSLLNTILKCSSVFEADERMPAHLEWSIKKESMAKSCYKSIMHKKHVFFCKRDYM